MEKEQKTTEQLLQEAISNFNNNEFEYVSIPKAFVNLFRSIRDKSEALSVMNTLKPFFSEIKMTKEEMEYWVSEVIVASKKTKEKMSEVVQAEIDEMSKLWEELDVKRSQITSKCVEAKTAIGNVRQDILDVQKELKDINFYQFEKLLESINKFNNMSEKDKELLGKLLSISSKE